MTKKSKIRKLRTKTESRTSGIIIKLLLLFLVGWLVIHQEVIENFIKNYYEQYNLLVHGRINYCSESVEYHDIIPIIRSQILHQDEALNRIETSLRNHIQFTPIAIIGTTGVGKTLFSNLLMKFFPWRENVQRFSWAVFADEKEKFLMVKKLLRRLSNCGHNLVVIDDFTLKDAAYVRNINKEAVRLEKSLILLYIFNIPSFPERAENGYKRVSEQLENLEGIQTIPFRSFDQSHLTGCIKYEAELLNVSLNAENILQIQNTIEATRSGCKKVYAKVAVFS